MFDAQTTTWSPLPEAPLCARRSYVYQAVGDQVVVWGGWWIGNRKSRALADGAVYDINTGEWRPMPASPLSARAEVSSAAVGGRVFMWSGSDTDRYPTDGALFDPGDDTWTLLPKAPVRKPHASAFVLDDLVLLTGGTSVGGRDVIMLVYSASSDSWVVPNLPEFVPTSFVRLENGDVYAWSCLDARTEHALLQSAPGSGSAPDDTAAGTLGASHGGTGPSTVEVDPGLLEYMAESSGAVHLQLQAADDLDVAMVAMGRARRLVSKHHPAPEGSLQEPDQQPRSPGQRASGASARSVDNERHQPPRTALFSVPHPEEPDDPLASFASAVTMAEGGPTFWFDIADAEVHDGVLEQVVKAMVTALDAAGATGRLSTPGSS